MNKRSQTEASPLRALSKSTSSFTLVALAVLAFVAASVTGFAQSNAEGGLFGRVIGATAAELAGATAVVATKDTNVTRSVPVSTAGTFEATGLAVGDYVVTVKLAGREPLTQPSYVSLNTTTSVRFDLAAGDVYKLEKFTVSSSAASPVNVTSTEIALNIRSETIKMLPVARDLTAVAMLSPGVSKGDTGYFGNLSSFAGASVAENAYYLNGFNITDFRRGLGYGTVPFEFFQEFQVKETGYSAEFGRSTGGVINAISKRGTNTYHGTLSYYWEPKKFNENGYDSYRTNGTLYLVRSIGSAESRTYNVEFSGPIMPDHVYFYGLYQGRNVSDDFMSGTNQWHFRNSKDPFWAARLDWQINANHALEYTTFSDKRTTTTQRFSYPLVSTIATPFSFTRPASLGANVGNLYADAGGRTQIGRYSGAFLNNDLTVSAMFGKSTKSASNRSDVSSQPYVVDQRGTTQVLSGTSSVTEDLDTRKAMRLDGTYKFSLFGNHSLKFGYDLENNKAHSINTRSGGGTSYVYQTYTGAALPNGSTAPAGTTQIAEVSTYFVGGDFRVITDAIYAEDSWKLINDRLTLNLGLRRENSDNRNGNDKSFIKLKGQYAPRLSFAYDLKGDGLSKVFGSWGRYFLQIPANTNVRLAGGETFYTDYYVLNSLKPDFLPNLGAQVGSRVVTGNGIVPDTDYIVNANVGPMYQDEFVIGYERALGKKWKASISAVYKDLKQVLEDEAVDAALLRYAKSKGYNNFDVGGFDFYVLTNPGADLSFMVNMTHDTNHDGVVDVADQSGSTKEVVNIPAGELGYPKATRHYYNVTLQLERILADKWFANFSYVWAHDYGNYEGSVYSDIGQTDAGITQLFDQPGLVDGTYGNLPNDRRHTFKAFGGYQPTREWLFTANVSAQSGRAISGLGLHPTDLYARAYGASSYYVGGKLAPRGSFGTTPWVYTFDVATKYKPDWGRGKLSFGIDVFNVFNWQTVTGVYERAETSAGASDTRFKRARTIQTPRYVRISGSFEF